jgi:putative acetyltransferase
MRATSFNEAEWCKMEIAIRTEQPADCVATHQILLSAFPTEQEANPVDRLRPIARLMISLVAESAREIVGEIAVSAVTVFGARAKGQGVGLAPV